MTISKSSRSILGNNSTMLVLKTPKTRTSTRKVFLPKTVAEMLIQRKAQQDEYKELLGSEYYDYNLVFCSDIGRPMEGSRINKAMADLIKAHDLSKVCFHSICHTSTTYKLKLTGGDIKAVQGDTGHNTAQMVTERYAHIFAYLTFLGIENLANRKSGRHEFNYSLPIIFEAKTASYYRLSFAIIEHRICTFVLSAGL